MSTMFIPSAGSSDLGMNSLFNFQYIGIQTRKFSMFAFFRKKHDQPLIKNSNIGQKLNFP